MINDVLMMDPEDSLTHGIGRRRRLERWRTSVMRQRGSAIRHIRHSVEWHIGAAWHFYGDHNNLYCLLAELLLVIDVTLLGRQTERRLCLYTQLLGFLVQHDV